MYFRSQQMQTFSERRSERRSGWVGNSSLLLCASPLPSTMKCQFHSIFNISRFCCNNITFVDHRMLFERLSDRNTTAFTKCAHISTYCRLSNIYCLLFVWHSLRQLIDIKLSEYIFICNISQKYINFYRYSSKSRDLWKKIRVK